MHLSLIDKYLFLLGPCCSTLGNSIQFNSIKIQLNSIQFKFTVVELSKDRGMCVGEHIFFKSNRCNAEGQISNRSTKKVGRRVSRDVPSQVERLSHRSETWEPVWPMGAGNCMRSPPYIDRLPMDCGAKATRM